jgi:hypothetical protein
VAQCLAHFHDYTGKGRDSIRTTQTFADPEWRNLLGPTLSGRQWGSGRDIYILCR